MFAAMPAVQKSQLIFVATIVCGILSRLIPHPDNFTPIIAMSLLAGAFASRFWIALVLPLGVMALSDLVLNQTIYSSYYADQPIWQSFVDNGFSYIALAVVALLPLAYISLHGRTSAGQTQRWSWLFAGGIIGSLIFYLLSNTGVWIQSGFYSYDLQGWLLCLIAGLPFLPATLLGTLLYGAAGAWVLKKYSVVTPSTEQAFARV